MLLLQRDRVAVVALATAYTLPFPNRAYSASSVVLGEGEC